MTTTSSGRPLRADALRNRAKVLAAAEDVFAEQGVSASTEEVARRAGVGIGPSEVTALLAGMSYAAGQAGGDLLRIAFDGLRPPREETDQEAARRQCAQYPCHGPYPAAIRRSSASVSGRP